LLRLFTYEVTNILHRQVMTSKFTYDEAKRGLKKLFSIGVLLKFLPYEEVSSYAMELAHHFNLSATYDAHYLYLFSHSFSRVAYRYSFPHFPLNHTF
jgi:predicted nucleic acid-binding protein